MKTILFLLVNLLLLVKGSSQVIFDIKIGAHQSRFDGMTEPFFFPSYIEQVSPIYASNDREVFFGEIISRQDNKLGYSFSFGLRKKMKKKWDAGLYIGFAAYRNQQLRDCGLTENYPEPVQNYLPGIRIYQTFTFKDNFVLLSPELQFLPFKKVAVTFSPSFWKRESSRYEGYFRLTYPNGLGPGQGVLRTNPDYRNTGFVLKGGILFYPLENINFGIEYTRFMTATNKHKEIEKSFYTSWGVKLGYSFGALKSDK